MYINRSYKSKYRRRSRWPLFLLLLLAVGAVIYALVSAGVVSVSEQAGHARVAVDPRNPFVPVLPSPTPTRTPLSYLAEAEDHYKAGRLGQALAAYAQVTAEEPANDEAYRWQAWLLILRGRPGEAVPLARKAADLKATAMNLGVLAMALDWNENYDEAIDAALKAVDRDPLSAEAHAFLAEVYADKNSWYLALNEAEAAVKINAKSFIAQRNLGYVLENQGRYKDALAAFEVAGQLAPNLGYIPISAGNTYMAMGDYEHALAEYQNAVNLNPDSPVGYDVLGHAAALAGDPDRALATLKQAIQVDPNYGMAFAHLGSAYFGRLNYEKAIENFQKAVDLGVRKEDIFYQFGLAYAYLDDCQNAATWLNKALEINPDSKPAHDGLQSLGSCGKKKP